MPLEQVTIVETPIDIDTLRQELNRVNQEIAGLIDAPPITLPQQAGDADADMLFLYGIVGGKDVGKTSLINQLAGAVISRDTDIIDEGTRVAVAYCHEADLAAVRQRLKSYSGSRLIFVGHRRPELQNVVLMDLPDYDSRFESHLTDVKALTRYLQGLVWVTSPRKYGDDQFLKQLAAVAQSHENYFVVLNKMDQLDAQATPEKVRREVFRFITEECKKRHIHAPELNQLFLVSAVSPEKYEFRQMHERLIRPHTAREIIHAKLKNLAAEFEQNLARMRSNYALDRRIARIDEAEAFVKAQVADHFSQAYCEAVSRRLGEQPHLQRRVIKIIFGQQVKRWPVLRSLFFPLTALISAVGGTLRAVWGDEVPEKTMGDILRYDGRPPAANLFNIRDQLLAAFPDLHGDMGDEPDYNEQVHHHFARLIRAYEERLADYFTAEKRKPGVFKRLLMVLPLAWFPFLQPLVLKTTSLNWQSPAGDILKEVLLFFISLLGSKALLTSLAFLGLFYTIVMMLMYAQSGRLVQKQGRVQFQDLWYDQFLYALNEMLVRPMVTRRAALSAKIDELAHIEDTLDGEISRLD